jgi:pimeloyl-ACP methyl ester carboxylesterase
VLGRGVLVLLLSLPPLVAVVCVLSLAWSAQDRGNWTLALLVLAACAVGVLVLAPFLDLDATDPNAGIASKVGYYTELMSGTPRLNVVGIPGARHFAMIDQPQRVTDAIRTFLKSL